MIVMFMFVSCVARSWQFSIDPIAVLWSAARQHLRKPRCSDAVYCQKDVLKLHRRVLVLVFSDRLGAKGEARNAHGLLATRWLIDQAN